jgi:glutathione peroxidase-family protein
VIPSLREWYNTYKDQGLVVIGNHYPEFSYERDLENLKEALVRLDVPYPVAQDNDRITWGAYKNRYWPTLYLIDKQGDIRYRHIGEGRYEETEAAIQTLLAETYP